MTAETILVTGASTGIGRELSRIAASRGHDVVLVARSADRLEALARELSDANGLTATAVPLDLASGSAVDELLDELDGRGIVVDWLVNNAGVGASGPFWQEDPARIEALLQLNVVTTAMLMRRLLPGMVQRRRGRVMNVASVAAFQPGPGVAAYHASKAFVLSLSMAARRELRGTGVTVTCLCPGPVDTEFPARAGQGNVTRAQRRTELSPEFVALAGFQAMESGRALAIPGVPMKVAVQLSRHAPLRTVAAVTERALRGTISGYR